MTTPIFPPVDNLYKFSALLGTIIIIVSFYYPFLYLNEYQSKIDNTTMLATKCIANADFTKREVDEFAQIVKTTVDLQQGKQKLSSDKVDITYTPSEVKEMMKEISVLRRDIDVSRAEVEQYYSQLDFLKSFKVPIFICMISSLIIGIYLSIWGYSNWYYKIQVYQDKALKKKDLEDLKNVAT